MASRPRRLLYDTIGPGYAQARRPDPSFAAQIDDALGPAATVLNVGAGTGNYEPTDRRVVALDPSRAMLTQRAPAAAPAVEGVAEHLPFPDRAFDATLCVLTLHHWYDLDAGLAELRRVASRQVVVGFDPTVSGPYWLVADYFPEFADLTSEHEAPTLSHVVEALAAHTVVEVPVPADCTDGFGGAYWNRPEAHLDPAVLASMSWTAQLPAAVVERGVSRLRADLESGAWDDRHGHLRELDELDLGYRIVISG